ncbi:MAG: MarR family transcriptional regulator [Planctomycetota bacterium]
MSSKQSISIVEVRTLFANIRRKIHSIPTKQKAYKDVTFAQLKVLRFLSLKDSAPMTDIARALAVTLPTATGLIDHLVENDYLKRRHQSSDRRSVHAELSVKGHKLLNAISKKQIEQFMKIRDSMRPDKWEKFVQALQTIDSLLESEKIS